MKNKKCCLLLISVFIFGAILLICYTKSINTKDISKIQILSIGNSDLAESLSGSDMLEIAQTETVPEKEFLEYTNMIVDKEYLGEENRAFFVAAIQNGTRILVLGDVPETELREYFGFDIKEADEYWDAEGSSVWVEKEDVQKSMLQLSVLGNIVYRSGPEEVVSGILTQDLNEEKMLEKAVWYCFAHDYAGQIADTDYSGNSSWADAAMYTKTYVLKEAVVNAVLKLETYKEAPNASGQYLARIPCTLEISTSDGWAVQYAEAEIAGADTSGIYEWKAESRNAKRKVETIKKNGGIDSSSVKVRYQPKAVFGINTCERSFMGVGIFAQTYQNADDVICGQSSFAVKVKALNRFGFAWGDEMVYTIALPACRINE